MLISDLLTTQSAALDDVAWVGASPPHHPAFVGIAVADADKPAPVRIVAVTSEHSPTVLPTPLRDSRPGDRWLLLTDLLLAEPAAHELAATLAEHGFRLLHAVYLDDAASLGAISGLSLAHESHQAPDRQPKLGRANLAVLQSWPYPAGGGDSVAGPNWPQLRQSFRNVAAVAERAAGNARRPGTAGNLAAALADAQRDVARLRSSATMRIGQAIVTLARNPIRNLGYSTRLLRAAWRAHRAGNPAPTTPPAATSSTRLDFLAPMPKRPDGDAPAPLRIEVPRGHSVATIVRRDGIGGYEPSMMSWFLTLCDMADPGDVWDVGANLGIYGLVARRSTVRPVVGFEPTPELAFWARHLARINDCEYRLEQVAAGEHAGVATFYLADETDSSNSLAEGFRRSSRHLDVLVEPLDRYQQRTGSVPAIMKVDTETTEHLVLRGAERVIRTYRPWIFCEVLFGRAPEQHLTAIMRAHGYRFYHLDGSFPLAERETVAGDPTHRHMNYLFAPGEIDATMTEAARAWYDSLAATPRPGAAT